MEVIQNSILVIEAWWNSPLLWPRILFGLLALAWVGSLIYVLTTIRRRNSYDRRATLRRSDHSPYRR